MQMLYRSGKQSADDPMAFVLSTNTRDSYGDVVEQDWDLRTFKKNPIALYQHNKSVPIGTWENVRVADGKLHGNLLLADSGTSSLIDTIRSLLEQRILQGASVGFLPGHMEPIEAGAPWEGFTLSENKLIECSLVSVPANSDALAVKMAGLPASGPIIHLSAYKTISGGVHAAGAAYRRRKNQITRLRVREPHTQEF